MLTLNADRLDANLDPALRAAKVPGAAIAIIAGRRVVFARAYGYRDLDAKLPMTLDTVYPIASTSKAINATLLAMLVDKGKLAWDAPVQKYLPGFRLHDALASVMVTVRDLVAMRTGLPRHDFVWWENPIGRAELVECFAHLPLSAGFRERFQYNNLTVTLAAHIAEIVTGETWENLVQEYIFDPLHMAGTTFGLPAKSNVSASYHESSERKLVRNERFDTQLIAPAGGTIHSTINDMSRWVALNLNGGATEERQLLAPKAMAELHAPQVVMGDDPIAPSPNATYGLGWAIDTSGGRARISHGGDLHDVISCVSLFPQDGVGIVSFVNLAVPRLARAVNQCAFNVLMGADSDPSIAKALLEYEQKIESTRLRCMGVPRVGNTSPSHSLDDYVGSYEHAGYGQVQIARRGQTLTLARRNLVFPLEHWHYDAWVIGENDRFAVYRSNPCERANRIVFEMNADGQIVALSMQLEPAVAPVRLEKRQVAVR